MLRSLFKSRPLFFLLCLFISAFVVGPSGDAGCLGGYSFNQCKPGEVGECYNGTKSTKGVGPCKAGKRTCGKDGAWGDCEGEVTNKFEVCDGVDNNCNGKVDDGDKICKDGGTCKAGKCVK